MAKVSIAEAARLAGISRSHLYKKYVEPGRITVETTLDGAGGPIKRIDTSEILRVFGTLAKTGEDSRGQGGRIQLRTLEDTQKTAEDTYEGAPPVVVLQERINGLEALLAARSEALVGALGERDRLLGIIEAQGRLLEHKADKPPQGMSAKPRRTWPAAILRAAAAITLLAAGAFFALEYNRGQAPARANTPEDRGEKWAPDNGG
jgi:hypothetical protein